ncbi:MAG: hypothetical protein A3E87_05495 [Gammaproteobacteria bacterium RIFCSPHIGHO2_12_FULL_35_23]|nr:MAG: hypothetical protein A3E87_05495 [Gammaproteobacteria bacterium RIFCSPHIGHO2_12_FULL_35_23]
MDIGCDYGEKTLAIIKELKRNCVVNTTAIDPAGELLNIFKQQTMNEKISFICATWQNYQPEHQFDLITAIHIFYYIDDWQTAIDKMLANIKDKGLICIVIRSNDEVCQFKDYFFQKIHGNNKPELNFIELCDLLDHLQIKYKSDLVQSRLNINDCVLLNEQGKELVEFFFAFLMMICLLM